MVTIIINAVIIYGYEYAIKNREDTKIVDYELESFHDEYEINPASGETRPEGGDYFKQISFILDDDNKLCICAEDSEVDGYCDVWVEHI